MYWNTILHASLVLSLAFIRTTLATSVSELEAVLRKLGGIPEVLQEVPLHIANVTWPTGVRANLGNLLPFESIRQQPKVEWPVNSSCYYTLLITDYDDKCNREELTREYHAIYVTNIPGIDVAKGEQRLGYEAPDMLNAQEEHRVVVSVLEHEWVNMSMSEFLSPPRYYFGVMELVYDFPARVYAANIFRVALPLNGTEAFTTVKKGNWLD